MASSPESSDSETQVVYGLKTTATYESLEASIFKGKEFLADNAGHHLSITNTNMKLKDNFSQLLILEVTQNKSVTEPLPGAFLN